MKTPVLIIALALAAACTPGDEERTAGDATPIQTQPPATAPPEQGAAASSAPVQASGVVESVDVAGGSVTINHGPIEALEWPQMTMTFAAPGIDLAAIEPGDRVTFDIAPTGSMAATVTRISVDEPAQ